MAFPKLKIPILREGEYSEFFRDNMPQYKKCSEVDWIDRNMQSAANIKFIFLSIFNSEIMNEFI